MQARQHAMVYQIQATVIPSFRMGVWTPALVRPLHLATGLRFPALPKFDAVHFCSE